MKNRKLINQGGFSVKMYIWIIICIVVLPICSALLLSSCSYDKISYDAVKKEFEGNKELFVNIRTALADKGEVYYSKEKNNYGEASANTDIEKLFNKYPTMYIKSTENYTYFEFGFNNQKKNIGIVFLSNESILENEAYRELDEYMQIHFIDYFDKLIDNWYLTSTMSLT